MGPDLERDIGLSRHISPYLEHRLGNDLRKASGDVRRKTIRLTVHGSNDTASSEGENVSRTEHPTKQILYAHG
jgi:hypothetical protein